MIVHILCIVISESLLHQRIIMTLDSLEKHLLTFENYCLRKLLHVHWHHQVINEQIRTHTMQPLVTEVIKHKRWPFLCLVLESGGLKTRRQADEYATPDVRKRQYNNKHCYYPRLDGCISRCPASTRMTESHSCPMRPGVIHFRNAFYLLLATDILVGKVPLFSVATLR